MPMNKPHLEFTRVDMAEGWASPPGYPSGIKQKILASDLDETRKMGGRTRLLRFDPGVYHGPFKSERGCMLFEIHYYDESKQS